MSESHNSKWTKREWVFLMVVVMLGQFIVQSAAFVYCGTGSALNYWSLVGISVSIILALLAIIWSYIQNMLQQRSSLNIGAQIERLSATVSDVNKSGVLVKDELDRLDDLSRQLQETVSLTKESRQEIHAMGQKVESTHAFLQAGAETAQDAGTVKGPDKEYPRFIAWTSLNGAMITYACYLAFTRKKPFKLETMCESRTYLHLQSRISCSLLVCWNSRVHSFRRNLQRDSVQQGHRQRHQGVHRGKARGVFTR